MIKIGLVYGFVVWFDVYFGLFIVLIFLSVLGQDFFRVYFVILLIFFMVEVIYWKQIIVFILVFVLVDEEDLFSCVLELIQDIFNFRLYNIFIEMLDDQSGFEEDEEDEEDVLGNCNLLEISFVLQVIQVNVFIY